MVGRDWNISATTGLIDVKSLRTDRSFRMNTDTVTGIVLLIKVDNLDATSVQNWPTGGQSQKIWEVTWSFFKHSLQSGSSVIFVLWSLTGVRYVLCRELKWIGWWAGLQGCWTMSHLNKNLEINLGNLALKLSPLEVKQNQSPEKSSKNSIPYS